MISRYRKITMPEGMGNWNKPGFDPEKAGWKTGKAPFGIYGDKMPDEHAKNTCFGEGCKCGTPTNTLWDKEVLLFTGTFTMPNMKPGYRYRLRVNEGDHVGVGGAYDVYINGKRLTGMSRPPRRGEGGLAKGAFLTKEWLEELSGKEFTIAVKAFFRYNRSYQAKPRTKIPQGRMSVHVEEMRMPPFNYEQVIVAASLVPMESAEWQANQFAGLNEEDDETDMTDGKFSFDGTFKPNTKVLGSWNSIGQVANPDDFKPGVEIAKELPRGRPPFTKITIKENGRTSDDSILWTGDRMMNLSKFEALRMLTKNIDGTDYLFVEVGNFQGPTGLPVGWTSPWSVMKRTK
jgi:hypothetical protein